MTVDKVELRRLAEECGKHGDNWYDSRNMAAFPEFQEDRDFVIAAKPTTVLALLDECERAEQVVNRECQSAASYRMQAVELQRERDAALADAKRLRREIKDFRNNSSISHAQMKWLDDILSRENGND